MRLTNRGQWAGGAVVLIGLLMIIGANAASSPGSEVASGWWVAGGFAVCGVGLAGLGAPAEASVMSVVLGLYVGVSAALAALLPARDVIDGSSLTTALRIVPLVRLNDPGPQLAAWAFYPTLRLASACGLVCVAAIVLARTMPRAERPLRVAPVRLAQAANILIGLGVLGAVLAALRFVAEHHGGVSSSALQGFWKGGAYLIFLGQFAIPGFGLRLSLLFGQRAPRRRVLPTLIAFIVFLLATIPTDERGFMIEGGLVIVAVAATHYRRFRLLLAPLVVVGLMGLVVTQAARDAARIDGTVNPSTVANYLTPDQWKHSLENQFASFQWAADLHAYGSALHGTNPLVALLAKPVPRQIWPGKPEGLSTEFTATVYPSASQSGVNFAVPLYAELQFSAGAILALLGFALLGGLLAFSLRTAERTPLALRPVTRALFLWAAFVLVRGDLSNSVPLAVASLLPVGFTLWWARVSTPTRLVIDALAVPPAYTGVGETVRRIGAELSRRAQPLPVEVVVRCAADVRTLLEPHFPANTTFETPLASSRPARRRLWRQLVIGPLRDRRSTLIFSTSELTTWWGRARRGMIVHDLRRRTAPATASSADRRLYNALVPAAVARADVILTVSQATADDLARELRPDAPVTVVAPHAGLALRPGSPPSPGAPLVVLSAIRPYKGAELLIDALASLDPGRRPRVAWVGAVELAESSAAMLRQRAQEVGLELLGWLPEDELTVVLDGAAAVLSPSAFEGYGLSLLEALRRGLPLLASDLPSHREIAGDAAVFFAASDVAALAELLGRWADGALDVEDLRRRSRARGEQLAGAAPSWTQALATALAELDAR